MTCWRGGRRHDRALAGLHRTIKQGERV